MKFLNECLPGEQMWWKLLCQDGAEGGGRGAGASSEGLRIERKKWPRTVAVTFVSCNKLCLHSFFIRLNVKLCMHLPLLYCRCLEGTFAAVWSRHYKPYLTQSSFSLFVKNPKNQTILYWCFYDAVAWKYCFFIQSFFFFFLHQHFSYTVSSQRDRGNILYLEQKILFFLQLKGLFFNKK